MLNYFINFFKNRRIKPEDFPECLECGVCCTHFVVSFNLDKNPLMKKHEDKILFYKKDNMVMKGTEKFNKGRCVALGGEINKKVGCTIYEDRPNVCREHPRVMPNGFINPRCVKARNAYLKKSNSID